MCGIREHGGPTWFLIAKMVDFNNMSKTGYLQFIAEPIYQM